MSVWLQLDSSSRSNPYIYRNDNWFPNDFRYNSGQSPQTPVNYRVFYGELNSPNNLRTIGFLAHCKERLENLTFSVEFCTITLPACTRVKRPADPVKGTSEEIVNIMDEPYIYIRFVDNENSEGDLIYTNNDAGEESTFIAYFDKLQLGTKKDNCASEPPGIPDQPVCDPPVTGNWDCPPPLVVGSPPDSYGYTQYNWVVYKSCMIMPMRLNLQSQEFEIRISDRFGNDLILLEDDNSGAGYPPNTVLDPIPVAPPPTPENPNPVAPPYRPKTQPKPDPDRQTMILLGIKPNYPI